MTERFNPECETCTYAWCCGHCYCCKPEPRPSYRFEAVWRPMSDETWVEYLNRYGKEFGERHERS